MTANPANLNSIAKVIADLQLIMRSARHRAVKAYDAEDMRSFEYWTGQADATSEAVDRLIALQDTVVGRYLTEVKQ